MTKVAAIAAEKSWRTTLEDRGITFPVESDTDVFVNASGGIKQRAVVFNWLKLGLNLDAHKLTGLALFNDTNIHAEAHYPAGRHQTRISSDTRLSHERFGSARRSGSLPSQANRR